MVFNCARQQNDEGTPEVVWHYDLKTTTFSDMCSYLKSTGKGLRKKNQMLISKLLLSLTGKAV